MMRMDGGWKIALASGRTVSHATSVAPGVMDALVEEYGINRRVSRAWGDLSTTQRLDCLATQILLGDRQRRTERLRANRRRLRNETGEAEIERYKDALAADVRGHILLPHQIVDRRSHEVFFPHLDFLDRTFRCTDWHWNDGGWYGDAPTVIAEVLPALYDAMPRTRPSEMVGIWWSPPKGTA